MWEFCGKAQFPHSFGWFARNDAETVPLRKISTPGNQVKLRYFSQCVLSIFIVKFEQISHLFQVVLVFILSKYLYAGVCSLWITFLKSFKAIVNLFSYEKKVMVKKKLWKKKLCMDLWRSFLVRKKIKAERSKWFHCKTSRFLIFFVKFLTKLHKNYSKFVWLSGKIINVIQ